MDKEQPKCFHNASHCRSRFLALFRISKIPIIESTLQLECYFEKIITIFVIQR